MSTTRITPSFDPLPPEARAMAEQAHSQMSTWIDQQVDAMAQDLAADVSKARDELQAKATEIQQELTASREALDALASQLQAASADLAFGDGVDLEEAISATQATISAVRQELASREARWQGLGSKAVQVVTSAATRTLGIPL